MTDWLILTMQLTFQEEAQCFSLKNTVHIRQHSAMVHGLLVHLFCYLFCLLPWQQDNMSHDHKQKL